MFATDFSGFPHPVSIFPIIIAAWLIIQGIITVVRGCPITKNPDDYTPESLKKYARPMGILMIIGGTAFLVMDLDYHDILQFSPVLAFGLLGLGFLTIIIYAILQANGLKKR